MKGFISGLGLGILLTAAISSYSADKVNGVTISGGGELTQHIDLQQQGFVYALCHYKDKDGLIHALHP